MARVSTVYRIVIQYFDIRLRSGSVRYEVAGSLWDAARPSHRIGSISSVLEPGGLSRVPCLPHDMQPLLITSEEAKAFSVELELEKDNGHDVLTFSGSSQAIKDGS